MLPLARTFFLRMKYKKQFGQHFLHDEAICKNIVAKLSEFANPQSPLLEIGPGAGAISKYLKDLPFVAYKAVEIDEDKVNFLIEQNILDTESILNQDFLKMQCPFEGNFHIVGNFPYNISSQIMFRILDWKEQVQVVVGMFQKEVALRIASKEGNKDYGILSVLLQAFYDVEYLFDVPAQAFTPPPKVMSGVLMMQTNNGKFQIKHPQKFAKLVKAAFAMRRKTLRNNWRSFLQNVDWEDAIFDQRAEQLSVEQFVQIYRVHYES